MAGPGTLEVGSLASAGLPACCTTVTTDSVLLQPCSQVPKAGVHVSTLCLGRHAGGSSRLILWHFVPSAGETEADDQTTVHMSCRSNHVQVDPARRKRLMMHHKA